MSKTLIGHEKCVVKGCNHPVRIIKHGLCRTHYDRYRETGSVGDKPIKASKVLIPYKEKFKETNTE